MICDMEALQGGGPGHGPRARRAVGTCIRRRAAIAGPLSTLTWDQGDGGTGGTETSGGEPLRAWLWVLVWVWVCRAGMRDDPGPGPGLTSLSLRWIAGLHQYVVAPRSVHHPLWTCAAHGSSPAGAAGRAALARFSGTAQRMYQRTSALYRRAAGGEPRSAVTSAR